MLKAAPFDFRSPYFSRKEIVPSNADSISMDTDTDWGPSGTTSPFRGSLMDVSISTQPKPIDQLDWSEGKLSKSSQPPDEYLKIFPETDTLATTTVSLTNAADTVAETMATCAVEDAVRYVVSSRVTPSPVFVPEKVLDSLDNFVPTPRETIQMENGELEMEEPPAPQLPEATTPPKFRTPPVSETPSPPIETTPPPSEKATPPEESTPPPLETTTPPHSEITTPPKEAGLPPVPVFPVKEESAAAIAPTVEKPQLEEKPSQTSQVSFASETRSPASPQVSSLPGRSKYWGEARSVEIYRQAGKSLGISIVGGRVEVSQKGGLPGTGATVAGIFIKSVMANSPAGETGQLNMGDRLLSVSVAYRWNAANSGTYPPPPGLEKVFNYN